MIVAETYRDAILLRECNNKKCSIVSSEEAKVAIQLKWLTTWMVRDVKTIAAAYYQISKHSAQKKCIWPEIAFTYACIGFIETFAISLRG